MIESPEKQLEIIDRKKALPITKAAIYVVENLEGKCAESTFELALQTLITVSRDAMREAGIEIVDGKEDFDDAVFFDFTMTDEKKIELLQLTDDDEFPKYVQPRIDALEKRIQINIADQRGQSVNSLLSTMKC